MQNMLKRCNLITEEGGILSLQNVPHSTNEFVIISKMVITHVGFQFRKLKKSQMDIILVSKKDGVDIQSYSWLLQQQQLEQREWASYPKISAHLTLVSFYGSTWMLPSVF